MHIPAGYRMRARSRRGVLHLDGAAADSCVRVPDHLALRFSDRFSMFFLWRADVAGDAGFAAGRLNGSTGGGWGMYNAVSGIYAGTSISGLSGGAITQSGAQPVYRAEQNRWHAYGSSYDATPSSGNRRSRIYLDGILAQSSDTQASTIPAVASIDFLIGNRAGAGTADNAWLGGCYADLKVYNRILTQDEMIRLQCGLSIDTTGLVIDMPLDQTEGDAINGGVAGVGNGLLQGTAVWYSATSYAGLMPHQMRAWA